MIIAFGKYKGTHVSRLDSSYIVYCLENFDLKEDLRRAMIASLLERFSEEDAYQGDYEDPKAIYKKLVLKYHPDKEGGSHHAMVAINEFYQLLKSQPEYAKKH